MKDVVTASHVAREGDRIFLDPTEEEEMKSDGEIIVAFQARVGRVVQVRITPLPFWHFRRLFKNEKVRCLPVQAVWDMGRQIALHSARYGD